MFLTIDTTTYIYENHSIHSPDNDSLKNKDFYLNSEKDSSSIYLSFKKPQETDGQVTEIEEISGHTGIKHIFSLEQVDGIFALLLLCFLFLTRIYKGGFLLFKENSRLVFSSRQDLSLFSETTITEFWYNFALLFQTALLAGIIMFSFCLEADNSYIPPNGFITILVFVVAICVVEALKYLLYKLIGYIFNFQLIVSIFLRSSVIIVEMMGIIAFIPVLLLVYSNHYSEILTNFFIILFIVSRLIIFYRIIIFFLRENVNLLYLIAYLCSVEIFPYFLLYKGLTYLYKIDVISLL